MKQARVKRLINAEKSDTWLCTKNFGWPDLKEKMNYKKQQKG